MKTLVYYALFTRNFMVLALFAHIKVMLLLVKGESEREFDNRLKHRMETLCVR